jgi:chemotaxis protein CheD
MVEKVGIGEYKVEKGKGVLVAYGLGSCIGLFLYDRAHKVAGLAHIMLAGRAPEHPGFTRTKYADNAVEEMLEAMKTAGAETFRITAVVIGGAHMFQEAAEARPSIGQRNLEGVRGALKRYNIQITDEDTGGDYGRTVEASVETGRVTVKSFRRGVKNLA